MEGHTALLKLEDGAGNVCGADQKDRFSFFPLAHRLEQIYRRGTPAGLDTRFHGPPEARPANIQFGFGRALRGVMSPSGGGQCGQRLQSRYVLVVEFRVLDAEHRKLFLVNDFVSDRLVDGAAA